MQAVAWHPSGAVLATAGTDGRLRLFDAVVPGGRFRLFGALLLGCACKEGGSSQGLRPRSPLHSTLSWQHLALHAHPSLPSPAPADVDGQPDLAALAGTRFGDCLLELPLAGGWGLAVAFSPSGGCVAAASQGSQLTLLSGLDLQDPASLEAAAAEAAGRLQHLALPCLPLKCLAFLTDGLLAGGGFDCRPVLCSRQGGGQWRYACSLQGVVRGVWAVGLSGHAAGRQYAAQAPIPPWPPNTAAVRLATPPPRRRQAQQQ